MTDELPLRAITMDELREFCGYTKLSDIRWSTIGDAADQGAVAAFKPSPTGSPYAI
jgi:hypothetical protein